MRGIRGEIRWRRVTLFYVVTSALTLTAACALHAAHVAWQGTGGALALNALMLLPGLVALSLQRFVFRQPLRASLGLRRPNVRWLAIAWLLAATIMLLALFVALPLPKVTFSNELAGLEALGMSRAEIAALRARLPASPPAAVAALTLQGLLLGPTACLLGGLGEELGWRGFLHAELAPLGFWSKSALIGLLWGAWHLPLVFQGYAYPNHPWVGAVLLLGLTQLLAPIYTRLRERSESVLVPAVFHGTCSASGVVAVAFTVGGGELSTGFTGLAGLIATTAVGAVFLRSSAHRAQLSE